jgi:hypothetical protein
LASLLPAPEGPESATIRHVARVEIVEIAQDGSVQLRIELSAADGSAIGERRVTTQGSCADLAEAASAILAAWETDPSPVSVGTEPVLEEARKSGVARPGPVSASPTQAVVRPGRYRVVLGAGGGIAVPGGLAAAARLDLQLGSVTSHWQLDLEGSGETWRQVGLAGASVDWRHSAGGLGLGWRSLAPKLAFSVDAKALVGWATLVGRGFGENRQQQSFEYGASAGVRVGRQWRRWQVWADLRPMVWLQRQRAILANAHDSTELPALDLMMCVGASSVLFP